MNGRMLVSMAVVVMLAGYDAGPRCMGEFRLPSIWGADPNGGDDPVIPICNGRILEDIDCPYNMMIGHCGKVSVPKSAAPGGVNDKRFDPSNRRACNKNYDCEQFGIQTNGETIYHWEFVTNECKKVFVPVNGNGN